MSFTIKTFLGLTLLTIVAACAQMEDSMGMDKGMVMEEKPMAKM